MMDSAFTIDFTKLLTQILFVGSYINNFIVKGLVALGVPLSASQVQVLLAIIYRNNKKAFKNRHNSGFMLINPRVF